MCNRMFFSFLAFRLLVAKCAALCLHVLFASCRRGGMSWVINDDGAGCTRVGGELALSQEIGAKKSVARLDPHVSLHP